EAREPLAALFGSPESAGIPACAVPGEDQPPRSNGAVTTKVVTTGLFSEESDADDFDWPPRGNGAVTTKVVTRLFPDENDADDFDWPPRSNDFSSNLVVTTKVVTTRLLSDENDADEPIAIIGVHGYYPHSANLDEYWENLRQGRDLTDVVA